ncbi:MAG: hypothetical protein JO215_15885 [Ktedonobacteraceae bacterium]|nr:hypothetical protein [Ktedonobacteraceae bacterium]
MDIVKQVKDILEQQNPQQKDNLLEQLSQVLEYHHGLSETDIAEGISLLLNAASQEENSTMRETFLSTISTAVSHHDMGDRIDWNKLVAMLPSLGNLELPYALNILGFSGQASYLPVLETYTHHADSDVREWADDAIDNITSRMPASDTQKENS